MRKIIALCMLLSAMLTQCNTVADALKSQPYAVTGDGIAVGSPASVTANTYQRNAYVNMFSIDGKLYYYISCWPGSFGQRSKFDRKICTVAEGQLVPVLEPSEFFGADDTYVYCQLDDYIVAHNIITDEAVRLLQCKNKNYYNATQEFDGTIRMTVSGKDDAHYTIRNGEIIEQAENEPFTAQYTLNGNQYYTDGRKIYCQGIDISDQFGSASYRALIPYQDGLLLINDGYGNLLYYIQNDGTILSLFPEFPCMDSKSSINFYEDYIFLSFCRWEKYDDTGKGVVRYENDSLIGTYRIDMRDFSTVKISDHIYNGMFIFDDMSIYACDRDGDIHKLDFDGNIKQRIVD